MAERLHPVSPRLRTFAREQRRLATRAEDLIWQNLRAGRLNGIKFKRQVPIPPYIVDFLCAETRLVIELDGEPHHTEDRQRHDALRDAWLAGQGFTVLRFPNDLVLGSPQIVFDAILAVRAPAAEPSAR